MNIDHRGHVSAPAALWADKSLIQSHHGSHGLGPGVRGSDDDIYVAPGAMEIA
jgi:hypothetical protein